MKVAFVYDRVNKWGGAERVLLELRKLFPDAPLFTSVYNRDTAAWADPFDVRVSFVQSLPFAKKAHEFYALTMPIAFEQFSFDEFDLVISVSSEAAKGILTKPQTKHLSYCLTPTRYLWSGHEEYFSSGVLKTLAAPAVSYLRGWDRLASQRSDTMIAISSEVRTRILTYYNRDADVIYPPVSPPEKKTEVPLPLPSGYFLVVSRLVPYKKVELAVKACNTLQAPLVIVGTGSEEKKLKTLAGPTVRFTGSITDNELANYYENCSALLFPGIEDFGITVVEAQFFGKPVIAYKKGGVLETILEGKTGLFFTDQTESALIGALRRFDRREFSERACRVQAKRFSSERFKTEFQKAVSLIV